MNCCQKMRLLCPGECRPPTAKSILATLLLVSLALALAPGLGRLNTVYFQPDANCTVGLDPCQCRIGPPRNWTTQPPAGSWPNLLLCFGIGMIDVTILASVVALVIFLIYLPTICKRSTVTTTIELPEMEHELVVNSFTTTQEPLDDDTEEELHQD